MNTETTARGMSERISPERRWTAAEIVAHVRARAEEACEADSQVDVWECLPPIGPLDARQPLRDALASRELREFDWTDYEHHESAKTQDEFLGRHKDLERVRRWGARCGWSDDQLKALLRDFCAQRALREQGAMFSWAAVDSKRLASLPRQGPISLIQDVLYAEQHSVWGGGPKMLKTLIAADAAVSAGTGTAFLGRFPVPKRVPVWFLSGESGQWAVRDAAERICAARGVSLADSLCYWSFSLPEADSPTQMKALGAHMLDFRGGLVILDPLYLLLGGGVNAASMFELGAVLSRFTEAAREAGTTLIVIHHTIKDVEIGRPLRLGDLAYSVGQWARQWILLNRRKPYAYDGRHELVMAVGGSAGHAGLYDVDVDEGPPRPGDPRRKWAVVVREREQATAKRPKAKRQATAANKAQRVLAAYEQLASELGPERVSWRKVRELAGMNDAGMDEALPELQGVLEVYDGYTDGPNGSKVEARMLRRVGECRDAGTNAGNPAVPGIPTG